MTSLELIVTVLVDLPVASATRPPSTHIIQQFDHYRTPPVWRPRRSVTGAGALVQCRLPAPSPVFIRSHTELTA